MFSKDKEEMLRYEAALRYEMDYVSHMSSAELKGEERGRKAQALETAKKMLQANFSLQQIEEISGLPESEILRLKP